MKPQIDRSRLLRSLAAAFLAMVIPAASCYGADLDEGKRSFLAGDFQGAQKALREVVAAEPDNHEANYYLGMSLLEQQKYGEAEPFLKQADSGMPEARIGLARVNLMQDRLPEAMRLLDSAQKARPDDSEVYQYRGMILLKQEKASEAAEQLSKAVELDPKNAYAHYYLGMANNRLKKTDQMIREFQLFLQLAPKAPEAAKVRSLLRTL